MKSYFFSLKTSFVLLILLAIVFGVGSSLALVPAVKLTFRHMTSTHLCACLNEIETVPSVAAWVLVLICLSIALFINTVCCTARQIKLLFRRQKKTIRSVVLAAIHVVAVLVLTLHGLDVLLIERHEPVKLYPGQRLEIAGYDLQLMDVTYTANPVWITEDIKGRKTASIRFPRRDFAGRDCFARIEVTSRDRRTSVHEIGLMEPARIGGTYFFLETFFIAHNDPRIGIEIHACFNPLVPFFFGAYIILSMLLVVQFFVTMQEKEENPHELY